MIWHYLPKKKKLPSYLQCPPNVSFLQYPSQFTIGFVMSPFDAQNANEKNSGKISNKKIHTHEKRKKFRKL
jgi:hypothetical protein